MHGIIATPSSNSIFLFLQSTCLADLSVALISLVLSLPLPKKKKKKKPNRTVDDLQTPGVYAGNDCLVAYARLRGVDVVVHQASQPPWVVSGYQHVPTKTPKQIHLAYFGYEHCMHVCVCVCVCVCEGGR